ncbi:MAG: AAA family ATPase [Nitrospirae bacterium]|nr:AAA family ATPase [Nitrospirota bacterium]
MRLPSFRVQNQRSVFLAECLVVPKLMVIAGPNGTGKSTLLNALRTSSGDGPILYVGPHRNARRQVVQWRHLLSTPISFQELLTRSDIPGYEGVALVTGTRDPWSFDDSANYLKHGLCQIEVDRKDAIAQLYDNQKEIGKNSLPDPWAPLKELTNNLLPHMSFERIDSTNRNQVRVLWRVHAKDTLVDLDDLSSGEKAIIQIFYPLVEARTKDILRQIQHADGAQAQPEVCVLIDEPELHLHPNLQIKVYDYLRLLASNGKTQVIIATHSPTIVEYANFEELFLLRPSESITAGENQLVQVATDEEKLAFLRGAFGTTSNLTAMQSVVVVEGITQNDSSKTVSDRKIYRALHPGFDRVTLVSGGGKSEAIRLRLHIQEILRSFSSNVTAVALLDRDLSSDAPPEGVVYLPVSMIENLLIDPVPIWESLQSVIEKTPFKSLDNINAAIDEILTELTDSEIHRRVIKLLGSVYFRPSTPLSEIPKQAQDYIDQIRVNYSEKAIETYRTKAVADVDELRKTTQRREYFHGKDVIALFSQKYLHKSGMPLGIFRYETARHAKSRKKVTKFFDEFFSTYLPHVQAPIVAENKEVVAAVPDKKQGG